MLSYKKVDVILGISSTFNLRLSNILQSRPFQTSNNSKKSSPSATTLWFKFHRIVADGDSLPEPLETWKRLECNQVPCFFVNILCQLIWFGEKWTFLPTHFYIARSIHFYATLYQDAWNASTIYIYIYKW